MRPFLHLCGMRLTNRMMTDLFQRGMHLRPQSGRLRALRQFLNEHLPHFVKGGMRAADVRKGMMNGWPFIKRRATKQEDQELRQIFAKQFGLMRQHDV